MLRIDVSTAHLDSRELVTPNAPVENFLLARVRVVRDDKIIPDHSPRRPVFQLLRDFGTDR
jgi:hypothetical protein